MQNETIVFVEFSTEGYPYQVVTRRTLSNRTVMEDYDFDWSKKYGLLYSPAGFLSEHPIEMGQCVDEEHNPVEFAYWAASDVQVKEPRLCKRLVELPEAYTAEKLFDFRSVIKCDRIIWCSICQDCMPDNTADLCAHVWWCEICCEMSTPDERCGHERGAEDDSLMVDPDDYPVV